MCRIACTTLQLSATLLVRNFTGMMPFSRRNEIEETRYVLRRVRGERQLTVFLTSQRLHSSVLNFLELSAASKLKRSLRNADFPIAAHSNEFSHKARLQTKKKTRSKSLKIGLYGLSAAICTVKSKPLPLSQHLTYRD